MGKFFKDFSAQDKGKLATDIARAVVPAFERGNPGGDGALVEVSVSAGSGSATLQAGLRYAHPVGWSQLPPAPGCAWTISGGSLSVQADGGFSGTIYFWAFS